METSTPSPAPAVAPTPPVPAEDEDSISLLDLLITLVKHKFTILAIAAGATTIALVAALVITPTFTATTRILLPQNSGSSTAAALLAQNLGSGAAAGLAGGALGLKNPSDQYIGLLKSRTVGARLNEQFKLQTRYEAKTVSAALKTLGTKTTIAAGKDGIISIDVDDHDPKFAAQLANGYVEALNWLTKRLALTEVAQRRLFFEGQLKQAHEDLAEAEDKMKAAQKKTGLIQLDAQAKAMIEATTELRAQIAMREVELSSLQTYATEKNPDYIRLKTQIETLRGKLKGMEGRAQASPDDPAYVANVPDVGLKYLRLMRDLKYRETLYELLAKQYEMARLEEARQAPVMQVLDVAVPPEQKSKPKRALMVVLGGLGGLFIGILFAFMKEGASRSARNPEQAARWAELKHYLWKRKATAAAT